MVSSITLANFVKNIIVHLPSLLVVISSLRASRSPSVRWVASLKMYRPKAVSCWQSVIMLPLTLWMPHPSCRNWHAPKPLDWIFIIHLTSSIATTVVKNTTIVVIRVFVLAGVNPGGLLATSFNTKYRYLGRALCAFVCELKDVQHACVVLEGPLDVATSYFVERFEQGQCRPCVRCLFGC